MRISDWSSDVCSSDLRIGQGAAVRAEAPWAGGEARRPSKSLRLVLLGLALAAAATLFAASNDRMSRFVEGVVAGWTADPAQGAKAAKQKAIAKLITETETDSVVPTAEGADPVARNALLPVSTLPVEAGIGRAGGWERGGQVG